MNAKKTLLATTGVSGRRAGAPTRHTALALAIAMGFGLSGQAFAQSTTGTISGQAPAAAGESVQVVGGSGFNRTVPVDKSGRYSVTLPVGTYSVTLLKDGAAVQTQKGITPTPGATLSVNFAAPDVAVAGAANAQTMATVSVSANAIPPIDVKSSVDSQTITAEQLKHLPVARSAEAIALLAPGTVQGAGALGTGPTGQSLVSFGGASVAENAYYINGFNTSDPLGNAGGVSLPYGSIEQQQTLVGGYDAQYGRTAGGVISQIGKSGTNDFHFGGQVLWQPASLGGTQGNYHYNNPLVNSANPGQQQGDILQYRNDNKAWNTVYDGYVSGPLIKDKLFIFLSAEVSKAQQTNVQSIGNSNVYQQKYSDPKFYGKLDWNITDNNVLSLTGIKNTNQYQGQINSYNYANHTTGPITGYDQSFKNAFSIYIAKYTGYITDDLTVNAMYGKMSGTYYSQTPQLAGYDPTLPNIINGSGQAGLQNPAYTGGAAGGITNPNQVAANNLPGHESTSTNLRLDLEWKLGNHDITAGIDNVTTQDIGAGNSMSGPGYAWQYGLSPNPTAPTVGNGPGTAPYVGPTAANPGTGAAQGYYASKYVFLTDSSVQVTQRAQYIKDDWQVAPNLLLNLGLRNDQFTNYNPDHQPYVRLTSPQWAPRLGFSWDVFGDSSMKVFGSAGRYYLALPSGVALREAGASTYTNQYYTYTGIDSNGIPSGLTPIASNPNGPVSVNGAYGAPIDPQIVRSNNLKAEYQDQFKLGMSQQFATSYVYGVTATVSKLRREIDDVGDTNPIIAQTELQNPNSGGVYDAVTNPGGTIIAPGSAGGLPQSILINPGSSNQFNVPNTLGGNYTATVSPSQFGFPKASRNYYSLEAFLEHPFDGKWQGKIDYVFSKSYGTTEGPVQSNIGQGGNSVSATEQWDYGQIMSYANGDQANSRRHVLKAYGTYQIAKEWSVSGILTIASGTPVSCLGYYGPDQSNPGLGYGSAYHWCGGVPAPGGTTGSTPWLHTLNLSAEYRPSWGGNKLGFQIQVQNVFNEQKATQIYPTYGSTLPVAGQPANSLVNPLYGSAQYLESPRIVMLGVTYDF